MLEIRLGMCTRSHPGRGRLYVAAADIANAKDDPYGQRPNQAQPSSFKGKGREKQHAVYGKIPHSRLGGCYPKDLIETRGFENNNIPRIN